MRLDEPVLSAFHPLSFILHPSLWTRPCLTLPKRLPGCGRDPPPRLQVLCRSFTGTERLAVRPADERLKSLEAAHPELVTPDSPTQRIGDQPVEGLRQVTHRVPMLSIENTYSLDELQQYGQRVAKLLAGEQVGWVVELKVNGVAVSLVYEDGLLVAAASPAATAAPATTSPTTSARSATCRCGWPATGRRRCWRFAARST